METVDDVSVFVNQAEQQVLALDRGAAKLAGFVPGEKDDSPRPLCESFKHG